jgi:hypothetical protein
MPTPVEIAESRAKAAVARLESSAGAGMPFAFSPADCAALLALLGALRDAPLFPAVSNPFERPCPACGGRRDDDDEDDPCDGCDNLGLVPTALGRKILDMVERHYITNITDDDIFMTDPGVSDEN